MSAPNEVPWATLVALGAFHGVNPGMGWLLAAGVGMHRESRGAVWRAMAPIAVGHVLAVALALAVAGLLGAVLPTGAIRWGTVVLLVSLAYRSFRGHRHFGGSGGGRGGGGGMRMRWRELVSWSFLIATAHGAGLMVIPVVGGTSSPHAAHLGPSTTGAVVDGLAGGQGDGVGALLSSTLVTATVAHSAGFILASAALAALVYECAGLGVLRRAWVNLDLVWGTALLLTAGGIAVR